MTYEKPEHWSGYDRLSALIRYHRVSSETEAQEFLATHRLCLEDIGRWSEAALEGLRAAERKENPHDPVS